MKRAVKVDPFFDQQPRMTFIEELSAPLHKASPAYYGKRSIKSGEVDARGIYIASRYPDDPEPLYLLGNHRCTPTQFGWVIPE